jgi:hypothetical protein
MPKNRLTCKQKHFILKDEKEAVKMYRDLGFPKQSKNEAQHLAFFKKQPCGKTK